MIKTTTISRGTHEKVDKFIFILCIIDILFLPYIRIASASISMILLPIWYVFNLSKIKITTDFKMFFPLTFLVITSLILSFVTYPGAFFLYSSVKYVIILMYGFIYFFFFKFCFEKYKINFGRILSLYVLFGFSLAAVYLANPQSYFKLRTFWTLSGKVVEVTDVLIMNRFTSTFSDPNNAAIVFVSVLAFLLFNLKVSFIKTIALISATLVILSATMSSTGFALYGLTIGIYLIKVIFTKNLFVLKKSTLLYIFLLILLSPFIYISFNSFFDSTVVQTAIQRVSENSADSRFIIWKTLLESENIFKYMFLGMGGNIIIHDNVYAPHNGNLHLIYNYGMIAYVLFMWIFFRKRKNTSWYTYVFIIVFFIGFTMNVGIYEPRFMNILALLVAGYVGMSIQRTKDLNFNTEKGRQ